MEIPFKALLGLLKSCALGEHKAIKAKVITALTGINAREIRLLVHEMRINGYPVCSGNDGYFYASTSDELEKTIRRMRRQIIGTKMALSGLEKAVF